MNTIEFVHKSQAARIKSCSRQLYYSDILQIQPAFQNETALAGQSFHAFGEEIYRSKKIDKWDDWKYWVLWFVDHFNKAKEECIKNDIEINTVEDIKAEHYAEMITGFLKQEYNRQAIPILLEAPFRFYIKRKNKQYGFEGKLDQLIKIPSKLLPNEYYREKALKAGKEYVYIHRDLKSGKKKLMSKIALLTNDDINFYAYALAFGKFDLKGTGNYDVEVKHIPFAHAIYWCIDHIAYKRNTEFAKKGDDRGGGMFFIEKTYQDLKDMEEELVNLHIKINRGPYTRDGASGNLCQYCAFKESCEYEWDNH